MITKASPPRVTRAVGNVLPDSGISGRIVVGVAEPVATFWPTIVGVGVRDGAVVSVGAVVVVAPVGEGLVTPPIGAGAASPVSVRTWIDRVQSEILLLVSSLSVTMTLALYVPGSV